MLLGGLLATLAAGVLFSVIELRGFAIWAVSYILATTIVAHALAVAAVDARRVRRHKGTAEPSA